MATTIPPRRINVELVETTMESSKDKEGDVEGPEYSRFVPQPVETTTTTNSPFAVEPVKKIDRSSIDTSEKDKEGTKRPGNFTPELVETSTKSHRRFGSEPAETTVRCSKDQPLNDAKNSKPWRKSAPEPLETSTKTNRRFAPEPIETTTRSSKDELVDRAKDSKPRGEFVPDPIETSTTSNRRFAPEPIETSVRNSRKKFAEDWENQTANPQKRGKQGKKPRKFAPQLIETASRSRRKENLTSTLRPCNGSEEMHLDNSGKVPSPPDNTPTFDFSQNPLFLEIQRATSPFNGRRTPRCRPSTHCFVIPDLDPIESSESEGSTPGSPGIPPTYSCRAYAYERHSHSFRHRTRIRESVDESTSGYLLELAAKAAEKQLREQEMAAFPNGNYYEHVDHFVDHDDESVAGSTREGSVFGEVNWELKAMREYRGKQERCETEADVCPKSSPWENAAAGLKSDEDIIGHQKNDETERMGRDARPPLLGKDIKFPRCQSPEPARFDTTQGCDAVRIAMCYLTEQTQQAEKGESLWCGKGNGRQTSRVSSLWSTASSHQEKKEGLWGGSCINSGNSPPKGPTGILTPRVETVDLLSPCPTPSLGSLLPPTPPASNTDFACIDEKLSFAKSIDDEYGDDFVTQVYNYLSLGYPSMAQPFDEELSRISKIPISDLRQDDHLAKSRGYIRLGEDGNLAASDITEESCMRWRALRVYIREWAKQHPNMAGDGLQGAGIAARKGSWAV